MVLAVTGDSGSGTRAAVAAWWVRALALGAVLAYVLVLLGPTLRAEFWMIDDHEIVKMLGPDGRVSVGEVPGLLRQWVPERIGRFRPLYYTTKVMEAFAFGDRPWAWHASRVALACAVAAVVFFTAEGFVGPVAAAVAALLFFHGSHVELWARIGPAETYGVPLTVFGLGLVIRAVRRGRWRPGDHAPGLLLMLAAGFYKEAFGALPAAAIGLYVLWPAWRRLGLLPEGQRRWRGRDWAALAGACLVLGFLGVMTLVKMRWYGHVYAGTVSGGHVSHAAGYLLRYMTREGVWYAAPAVAAVVVLVAAGARRWRELGRLAGALLVAAALVLPAQLVFYGSSSMMETRYLMPTWLLVPACVAVGFWFIRRWAVRPGARAAAYGAVLAAVAGTVAVHAPPLYGYWAGWAEQTRDFQRKVSRIAELKRRNPGMPVLFRIDIADAFEPLLSTTAFVAYRLPGEAFYLRVDGEVPSRYFGERHARELMDGLRKTSEHGSTYLRPLASMPGGPAIQVLFLAEADAPAGRAVVNMMQPATPAADGLSGQWDSAEGLAPVEGPYPQWKMPLVRWSFHPAVRLTVSADADGAEHVLELEGSAPMDGQRLTVAVNGEAVDEIEMGKAWAVTGKTVRVRLRAGVNVVEIRSAMGKAVPGKPGESAVLYRKLSLRPAD